MRISDWSSDVCSSDLPRRRVPLGDVARHVDAAEEHRNAARAGALERREPVARLFEADAILHPQPVDVVPHRPRAGTEGGIRHQHRARGIVREPDMRSEEHTSELQSLMRISYAVFCLKKKRQKNNKTH